MDARHRGEDIIDFGMGNPDQPTPKHIVDKLVEASQRDNTHGYSISRGIPRLRRAICNWYKTRFDVDLDPETEAIVTLGSKEGLAHLAMAVVDKGDAVLVPNPAYPIHPFGFVIAGADVRHVPIGPGIDFFEELQKAIRDCWPKPKMLLINFPANPTAQCVDLEFFEKIINIASAWRERCCCRVFLYVEKLQHAGMACWFYGGQSYACTCIDTHEVIFGLWYVYSDTNCRYYCS